MVALQSSLLQLALMASLLGGVLSFKPLFMFDGQSVTHRDITERAVLQKTAEVCQDLAAARGQDFVMPASLSALSVQRACSPDVSLDSLLSTVSFQTSIVKMCLNNAAVDLLLALSDEHHFDSETFQSGRDDVITAGVYAVKASVKMEDFVSGRHTLGRVCHTLQDFYSHSNWVELGNSVPYSALITPDQALHNLADPSVPTCSSCTGENCKDNLLPELLKQGLLTSGYFSLFSSAKPTGKCSHGGFLDRTSRQDPVGGINKDDVGAPHGHLHRAAAELAVGATMDLLEDIRTTVGDHRFLQLMGVSQTKALCFVIDTTGSMSDDIAEAKRVSFAIIDSKRGTPLEPSAYILVPFNDPSFGPLISTTNADVFKASINILDASGGGDLPEMSLSGLQLALTAAPSSTEIFVFTDAAAKDTYLKGAVMALIESTKSVVTFMLTDILTTRRRRRSTSMSEVDLQLYRDLAQASGGQAIEVTRSSLPSVTTVIGDALAPAVVTIAQETRMPGSPGNFTFTVDGLLRSLTAYITGPPALTCTLRSPTGVSQACDQTSGPLGSFSSVGNLLYLSLNATNQTGLWEISVSSSGSYSVKVTGQSSLNFIYSLVEMGQGALENFSPKEGRPIAGGNMTLLVTVTGSDTPKVTQVTLVEASGSQEVNGSVQSLGSATFLVAFINVPLGRFMLRLSGEDSATSDSFQRQASTQIQTSAITVSVRPNTTSIEPGATVSIPYVIMVAAANASGPLSVRAISDKGSASATPDSVIVATGQAEGTVNVMAPADAPLGSSVTLTVQVADSDAAGDLNYAVLRLTLVTKVMDTQPPQCQVVSVTSCPPSTSSSCSATQWQLFANVTDGSGGSGVQSVRVRNGNGTLNVTAGTEAGVAAVTYAASCCTQSVLLVAVDAAGNANTCELRAAIAGEAGGTSLPTVASSTALPLPQLLLLAVVLAWQWAGGWSMF